MTPHQQAAVKAIRIKPEGAAATHEPHSRPDGSLLHVDSVAASWAPFCDECQLTILYQVAAVLYNPSHEAITAAVEAVNSTGATERGVVRAVIRAALDTDFPRTDHAD